MLHPVRLSVRDLRDPARELQALNERNVVLPLAAVAARSVHADIAQWPFPGLAVMTAELGGIRHGSHRGDDEHLYLAITQQGTSVAEQRHREVSLRDGESVLVSAADRFHMTHPGSVRFLGLRLSRRMLGARANDDAIMRLIPRDAPALSLLTRYLRLALDETLPASAGLSDVVASHVYDLAALAIGARPDARVASTGVRAARLRAIKTDVLAQLADPDLEVAAIAMRHRITPRYVHKLFETDATTFSAFVLQQRLARVHRMLRDPRFAGRSIGTLALEAGFGDLSYFNRAFRRRYGATPSDVRRRAR